MILKRSSQSQLVQSETLLANTDEEIMNTQLNTKQIRMDFLNSEVLKNIDSIKFKEKVMESLQSDQVGEMIRLGYVMILVIKFQPESIHNHPINSEQSLRQQVKLALNENYVKLFATCAAPKEQIINVIIFSCCYMIHHYFYHQHVDLRDHFDLRFIYDVYHIMIHSFNGMFESDYYIKMNIDKYFTKFLSYVKDKKEKTKKVNKRPEKSFLGKLLSFPDLNSMDGGADFSKTLHDCFKTKKRVQIVVKTSEKESDEFLQIDPLLSPQTKEQIYNFQRLQFNLNSVSPSVGKILHLNSNQLRGVRSKMVSHKIEKLNEKEIEVWQMLKEIGDTKSHKKSPKGHKIVKNNLIEMHELSMPAKEYFQRHPKVDPFIKNMLELNYVLQECPESLQQLHSSNDMRTYINDYDVIRANVGQAAKTSTAKQRIIQYLTKHEDPYEVVTERNVNQNKKKKFFGFEAKDPLQISTGLQSQLQTNYVVGMNTADTFNSTKQYDPLSKYTSETSRRKKVELYSKSMAQTQIGGFTSPKAVTILEPISQSPRLNMMASITSARDAQYEKKLERTFKLVNSAEDGKLFVYKDKVKLYNQQYDTMMNQVSTEAKINDLISSIQIRQNLVNKQLQKKIHKM